MQQKLVQGSFLILLIAATLLLGWILQPFFGAILWSVVIAVVFHPLQNKWAPHFGKRKNLLALAVLLLCTLIVILPLLGIAFSLVREGAALYQKAQSGELNLGVYLDRVESTFPVLQSLLQRAGIEVGDLQQQLTNVASEVGHYLTTQAFSFGQNTAQFVVSLVVVLYLTFFFLRDGKYLIELLIRALPLGDRREHLLLRKIAEVTNATVKGNLIVAAVQGSLGGLIFWILGVNGPLLWGVLMFFASLLPSVGSALIWLPVAVYFLMTGAVWNGIVLIIFGALVIGLVDNVLRPILVGRSTQIPDYLVLLSTLGGIAIFGLNGFVLGPLIAGVFIVFWDIFIHEFNPE